MNHKVIRDIMAVEGGPILVEGPVCITLPDGSAVDSDRFMVAICTCRRSKIYPLCDASHRKKERKSLRQNKSSAAAAHADAPDDQQSIK